MIGSDVWETIPRIFLYSKVRFYRFHFLDNILYIRILFESSIWEVLSLDERSAYYRCRSVFSIIWYFARPTVLFGIIYNDIDGDIYYRSHSDMIMLGIWYIIGVDRLRYYMKYYWSWSVTTMREILYQSIFYDIVWCTTGDELFESIVGVNLLGNYLRFCKNRFGLIIWCTGIHLLR